MRAIEKLLTLALVAGPCLAQFQVNTIRRGAECKSNDVWLGKYDNMAGCAGACADRKDEGCRFFIYGHAESRKAGDCYMEFTESKCEVEGFEEDSFDFLQLTADWIGCTEPRAPNFNAYATTDDGKESVSACSRTACSSRPLVTMNCARSPTTFEEGVTLTMSPSRILAAA